MGFFVRLVVLASLAIACGSAPLPPAPQPPPPDEAGFVDVPARPDAAYAARMFYVFRKADVVGAPLAVFFNGGPGFATSFGLLPYGTSPSTIDVGTRAIVPNAASWTSFANLLFVDERMSGFSYGLGAGNACSFDPVADASDFVRVVIHFLDAHPALTSSPVVFVGESYGGMRATYALDLLLRYGTEASRVDGALGGEIQAHYDRVFPDRAGQTIDEASAATQFGRVVLLEPFLFGDAQYRAQQRDLPADPYVGTMPDDADPYDVRQKLGWTDGLTDSVANALAGGGDGQLFGTSFTAIPELAPSARGDAFRTPPAAPDSTAFGALASAMTASLGPLGTNDAYVHDYATACADISAPATSQSGAFDELVANAAHVKTFISRARYDAAIYVPAIFDVLAEANQQAVGDAMHMVPYDDSGHMIEVTEPQKLHDDVAAWLASP